MGSGVIGHQKTWFSESFAHVEGVGNIIGAAGAVIRQSSSSKHSSKNLYCGCEGGKEPRRSKQRGFWLGNLHEKATIEAGSTLA
jgi:hypothetical protein